MDSSDPAATVKNSHGPDTLQRSYDAILDHLLMKQHVFFSPETSPHPLLLAQHSPSRSDSAARLPTISSLSLHPASEAVLHILNADLASAHFLLRHAQSPPAYECMFLHGVLHRIEGDIDNARCWYRDTRDSDVFRTVWDEAQGGWDAATALLERAERWRDRTRKRHSLNSSVVLKDTDWTEHERSLREASLSELRRVLNFCETRFGIQPVADARQVWVQPEGKVKDIRDSMLVGGEGWREF